MLLKINVQGNYKYFLNCIEISEEQAKEQAKKERLINCSFLNANNYPIRVIVDESDKSDNNILGFYLNEKLFFNKDDFLFLSGQQKENNSSQDSIKELEKRLEKRLEELESKHKAVNFQAVEKKYFTAQEAAEMLNMTYFVVHKYIQTGKLKGKKAGGKWSFTIEDLENFRENKK